MYLPNTTAKQLTYDDQVLMGSRYLSIGGGELIMSHAKYNTTQPIYQFNSANKKYAAPTFPVYVIVGTLDPQTINGFGYTFAKGLGAFIHLLAV